MEGLEKHDCVDAGFFDRSPDLVARDLLGCQLSTFRGDRRTSGIVVETEAYFGSDDPGSHAATRGVTARNRVMYGEPGTVYVYLTYGMHHLLNLVCESEGTAAAVLVRAIEPTEGIELMQARRGGVRQANLCNGPGKLTQALGIDLEDNDCALGSHGLWVYHGEHVSSRDVEVSGRIGLSTGHELALRYFVKDSQYVSTGRTGPRTAAARPGRRAS